MSTPEVQRVGAKPSGSTMGKLAETPSAALPLGTGSQEQQAIGDVEQSVSQSPDGTLSQFLQSPHGQDQLVPANPFSRGPRVENPSSAGPVGSPEGGTNVTQNNIMNEYHQTQVRQELRVSLDPFLAAQAHQELEQSRASIISQAQTALDQSREQLRSEAIQAVNQAQEAVRAEATSYVNQVQAEAVQSVSEAQTELERLRTNAANHATELRNRANAEIARVEVEARKTIASLEGRIAELIHERDGLTSSAQRMLDERDKVIIELTRRVQDQDEMIKSLRSTIGVMQDTTMRRPLEAGNGAEIRIHTPPEGFPANQS